MKHFSEQYRAQQRDAFMQNVRSFMPIKESPMPDANQLSEHAVNLLITTALHIGLILTVAYKSLGLHAAQGKRALDELLAHGFVRIHRLARKGSGGQPQVLEVLPKGKEELRRRGITPAEKKIKRGGFRHDVYARYLEQWAKEKGYHYWFERTLGQKAFDFVYEDEHGNLYGVEICLSGSAELNAQQAIKAAGVEGIKEVIIACERQSFLKSIFAEIRKIDQLGLYQKKISGKLLGEYVTINDKEPPHE